MGSYEYAEGRQDVHEITWIRYFRGRVGYILVFIAALLLSGASIILGEMYFPTMMDMTMALYAGLLAVCCILFWLAFDYLRQRPYYIQLNEAIGQASALNASLRVRSGVTADQLAVQELLKAQHQAYMDELGRYRRQLEIHQHFIHQWVHQMKTPIAVIDLITQQGEQADSQQEAAGWKSDLRSIQEETDRLTRGLDMMLYTARLEKFEVDVHIRSISLHETVRQVVNMHKRLCIRYKIYPQIEGEGVVQSDEKWMAFVINQLIGNAIKYSKQKSGSKKLRIRIASIPDQADGVSLQIIDEGIGIAGHDLPRIYEPFFTGDNGRLVEESTGMGLYLAKQVCAKLGHKLTVSSEQGVGTTATIVFLPSSLQQLSDKVTAL
ncbi:Sensor histidine kinase GraS [Paenibacillus plantiphilus]|uniref:histidine kinase n=1 Tax=Paenibacillus plantiphilus TaxID=2905650 RepID=A0ABM9BN34_9BACL|nr:sensor histidine kinase [Paenibacillus plantiphilus]CAH1190022.1 Sensor histidine kinase GraS [Paenibacillus plantiphilus]